MHLDLIRGFRHICHTLILSERGKSGRNGFEIELGTLGRKSCLSVTSALAWKAWTVSSEINLSQTASLSLQARYIYISSCDDNLRLTVGRRSLRLEVELWGAHGWYLFCLKESTLLAAFALLIEFNNFIRSLTILTTALGVNQRKAWWVLLVEPIVESKAD